MSIWDDYERRLNEVESFDLAEAVYLDKSEHLRD